MAGYFWFQKTGGEDAWLEALSEHRSKVIAETKPAFVTVLDAYTVPEETWGREDYAKMKYSGPLYFDWDADDIGETIPQFKLFLANLLEAGVDLATVRMFATGGRGFHMEIPEEIFNAKPPKGGTTLLPYIYKEMALELAVETLDLRVYTGRKGRMWRTPGVKRSNGNYKVPITADQALSMTPESYSELCSAPRTPIYATPGSTNIMLAALFSKAQAKVNDAIKARGKANKDDELLARHKGQFPPTILRLMAGENVAPGVGFQRIAMQLSITANALGKNSDELVKLCEGLIDKHQGDSQRYNSPRKRREELKRMWDYTHDNPCYGYSRGGIKSIVLAGTGTSDLDGMSESVGIGHVPESSADGEEEAAPELDKEILEEIEASESSLLEGMMILKAGVFKRTSDGAKMLSNISFRSPSQMVDAEDGLLVGLEADLVVDNRKLGRQLIEIPAFNSRSNLSKFCSGRGAIFSGTDTQAGVVSLLLSRSAIKEKRVIYIVRKEGLDIIQDPTVRDKVSKHVIWASPDGVMSLAPEKPDYRFQPKVSNSPVFRTDIHMAPELEDSVDSREWVTALLNLNSPTIVAQMLGWFTSCFHKQFYQQAYNQFPLLHPNGPAGSGKTLTTLLLAKLFHLTTNPVMMACAEQASTPFMLKSAWTGSASVPLILDEYKPSEMGPKRTELLLQHFRLLYNQGTGASGGINRGGSDTSFRDITTFTYSAPTAFLGETQEMQTAVMQRSLPVAFNKGDSERNTSSFDLASRGAEFMPRLGRLLLGLSLSETIESRTAAIEPLRLDLRAKSDASIHDRQVYNLAVVLAGLEYLQSALEKVFGGTFTGRMQELSDSVMNNRTDLNITAMSEAAKCLNDMSMISRMEGEDSEFAIRETHEYIIGEGYVEILMREAFVKYFSWCNRKGFKPLYSAPEPFMNAMGKSPALMDRTCLDSPLRRSGQSRVFRFSLEKLELEGVERFKSKSLD